MNIIVITLVGMCLCGTLPNIYGQDLCDDGWVSYNDHCYLYTVNQVRHRTWDLARSFCRSAGGELASIHSQAELHFLRVEASNHIKYEDWLYIGLEDHYGNGNYRWSDGTPVDYTNFANYGLSYRRTCYTFRHNNVDPEKFYPYDCDSFTSEILCQKKHNLVNECLDPKACLNGGLCVDLVKGYSCNCQPGYKGDICEIDINECSPDPCQNGATCVDKPNDFDCMCPPGYEGDLCDRDINECASSPCQNGATCVDMLNAFGCLCTPGYTGGLCEINIDECASTTCPAGLICEDGINSSCCNAGP